MVEPRRPRWLSEHLHALGWLAFAVAATVAYVFAHHHLKCKYIADIRPQITNAVQLYALRRHDVTGALELRVAATPYELEAADRGPLGIGALPEARGVLNRASSVVERYNLELRDYFEGLLGGFFPSPNSLHHMSVNLSTISPLTAGEKTGAGEDTAPPAKDIPAQELRLRVPIEGFTRVRHEYPNEQALNSLIDLIGSAIPVQVVADNGLVFFPSKQDGVEHPKVRQAVEAVSERAKKLRKEVTKLFETPCPTAGSKKCADTPVETEFHRQLREVVERNTGFFWTSGKFFWFEIMMLAALGVMTRQLVLFAKAYATRASSNRIWRPRDTVRTLMYLAVAPIFSLIVIWILTVTNVIVVKPVIGDVWSSGTVPIAFLLGLFPTLGYDVLRGLARGLFGERLEEEVDDRAKPKDIPEAKVAGPDGAASFVRLRQRVRHHAIAVFR